MSELTVNDPIPAETLQLFAQLEDAKARIALENLTVDERKIQLLAASKKLSEQRQRLFEALLLERGLAVDTAVEVNTETGVIKVLTPLTEMPKE